MIGLRMGMSVGTRSVAMVDVGHARGDSSVAPASADATIGIDHNRRTEAAGRRCDRPSEHGSTAAVTFRSLRFV